MFPQNKFSSCNIPCGLVARIRRFHRRGRGSIPRTGDQYFLIRPTHDVTCFLLSSFQLIWYRGYLRLDHIKMKEKDAFLLLQLVMILLLILSYFPKFLVVPCGLVARIRRSHRRGRGSIPRTGVLYFRTHFCMRRYIFLVHPPTFLH